MKWKRLLSSFLLLSLPAVVGFARPLVVGVTDSPPFSYQRDGEWAGISVELWDQLAGEMGIDYAFEPMSLGALLKGLEDGSVDVGAAALTTTAEREAVMDFSHPFYNGGLSVATSLEERSMIFGFLGQLFTVQTALALGALGLLLLGVGVVIWAVERKRNPEQFGGTTLEGMGSGFWWSAVTMTTVGYGDKAPTSLPGRVVGLVWMFASIILISGFTGAIASALTVSNLTPKIEGLGDLYEARIGAKANSKAAHFLDTVGVDYRSFDSTEDGLEAVENGSLDGFVNDAPVLRYYVGAEFADTLTVIDATFDSGFYAFAFTEGFESLSGFNEQLLEAIESPAWKPILKRHLPQ